MISGVARNCLQNKLQAPLPICPARRASPSRLFVHSKVASAERLAFEDGELAVAFLVLWHRNPFAVGAYQSAQRVLQEPLPRRTGTLAFRAATRMCWIWPPMPQGSTSSTSHASSRRCRWGNSRRLLRDGALNAEELYRVAVALHGGASSDAAARSGVQNAVDVIGVIQE